MKDRTRFWVIAVCQVGIMVTVTVPVAVMIFRRLGITVGACALVYAIALCVVGIRAGAAKLFGRDPNRGDR